ncbi:hypothetical protein OE88DRAFT_210721 [Heliocybe sulcata]|uniref:Uncharacterized protein n=1 Tax=Heliocybe sulcata TaxID=5364 RepID=A0A5C3MZY2_9AGAM|nr:hypothetical protein OE88DRAFT_210721 [Heliocybe sulcata]
MARGPRSANTVSLIQNQGVPSNRGAAVSPSRDAFKRRVTVVPNLPANIRDFTKSGTCPFSYYTWLIRKQSSHRGLAQNTKTYQKRATLDALTRTTVEVIQALRRETRPSLATTVSSTHTSRVIVVSTSTMARPIVKKAVAQRRGVEYATKAFATLDPPPTNVASDTEGAPAKATHSQRTSHGSLQGGANSRVGPVKVGGVRHLASVSVWHRMLMTDTIATSR